MKAPLWMRTLTPTGFVLLSLGAAVFVFGLWWFATEPGRARNRAAQAKAGQIIAEGQAKAGGDAIVILDGARTGAEDFEQLGKEAQDETRKAEGADTRLPVPVNRAGRGGVCSSDAYRGSTHCLQQPDRPKPSR